MQNKETMLCIQNGEAVLGIEMGSTRIKAILIDRQHRPIASGSYEWENRLEDGIWTYHMEDVWSGIQESYKQLADFVYQTYHVKIEQLAAIGFSGMMHGYLVFDQTDRQLVPFRTWRNTITKQASEELTALFHFNIPQRFSIAHLYQAICNGESHVPEIAYLTTLSGYVHWQLTGEKVLGIGEAAGVFPIDSQTKDYDAKMLRQFDQLPNCQKNAWKLKAVLPKVLCTGQMAGRLTEQGARLLDPTGTLQPGIPFCPPEGDAGTGMTATNSVAPRTGNVSAGTSIFAMVVLEKNLNGVYPEIDMVTTPSGEPVAMVHCNNCTSDLDAWVRLFCEYNQIAGIQMEKSDLYALLYQKALEGAPDCGGILSYNYISGEPVVGLEKGLPLLMRLPDSQFDLSNFMRAQLFAAMGTLKIGMDILFQKEEVRLDCLYGHGGLFKTPVVGQRLMAAAMNTPVTVLETAGEGGAWGIALLAAFMLQKENNQTLENYLQDKVFRENAGNRIEPNPEEVAGFTAYMQRYTAGLKVEKAATEVFE